LQTELSKLERAKYALARKYSELEKTIDNLQKVRYRPLKFDEVDKYMSMYINASGVDLGLTRIDVGFYELEGKKHHFNMKTDGFFIRRGAGISDAHVFLDTRWQKVEMLIKPEVDLAADVSRSNSKLDFTP